MSNLSRSHTGLLLRVRRADGSVDEHYAVAGVTIGRSKANTLVLAGDTSVDSVHHARVEAEDGGSLYLRCPAANTALEVDGRLCREVALAAGVKVCVGNTEIECVSCAAETATPMTVANSACPFCQNSQVALGGADPRPCPACGKSLLPIPPSDGRGSPVLVPTDFNGFRAEQFVTRGGMGIVLRGSVDHSATKCSSAKVTNVAIKLLEARTVGESSTLARFRQEIELLSRVQHPNVVQPIGSGNIAGFEYLVMAWIEGGSLKDMLDRARSDGGMIPFDAASQWFEQVALGLDAIHSAGVIHRDLKPSNLLLGSDNQIRIADLGVAKAVDDSTHSLTTTGQLPGTLIYMAPEQLAASADVDARADLYSLGVTFYELLTNQRPLGAWLPASQLNQTVPKPIDKVLTKLLNPDPSQRYADARQLLDAWDAATKPTPPQTSTGGQGIPTELVESAQAVPRQVAGEAPPLLPVLVGAGAIMFGIVNGLLFLNEATGLTALLLVLTLLQIPGGIGILLHRPWGRQLTEASAFGIVCTSGLGMIPSALGYQGSPIWSWGFATGLIWAACLKIAFRSASMTRALTLPSLVSRAAQSPNTTSPPGQPLTYRHSWNLYAGLCASTGLFCMGFLELLHVEAAVFIGFLFFAALILAAIGTIDKELFHKELSTLTHPKLLRTAKWLCGVGILLWMMALLQPAVYEAKQAANKAAEKQRAAEKHEIISLNNQFSLQTPAVWETDSELGGTVPGSVIHVSDRAHDIYLIATTQNKADIVWANLNAEAESRRKGFFETLSNPQLVSTEQLMIANKKAIQFEFTGVVENIRIAYVLTLLETETHAVMILGWTLPSQYQVIGPKLKEAISSFKELPAGSRR